MGVFAHRTAGPTTRVQWSRLNGEVLVLAAVGPLRLSMQ